MIYASNKNTQGVGYRYEEFWDSVDNNNNNNNNNNTVGRLRCPS